MSKRIPSATEMLEAWDAQRTRSMQDELGISNLGGCRRAAGYRIHDYPAGPVPPGTKMKMILGTAVHETFAQAARLALGQEAIVEDEEVRFAGVPGHPDLVHDDTVVDLKTTGFAIQIEKIRREGPPRQHKWQASCYAAALILQGRPIRKIRLDYIDRGSGEEFVWEGPFDMAEVRDAMEWLHNVRTAPLEALPRDYAPDSAFCASCPYFTECWGRGVPERDPRSVLFVENPDAEAWLKQLAEAREAKAAAEALESEAKGALDALRTVSRPGESQDIVAGSMKARISVGKGRRSLDKVQVAADYAAAGREPPYRQGDPVVSIQVLT